MLSSGKDSSFLAASTYLSAIPSYFLSVSPKVASVLYTVGSTLFSSSLDRLNPLKTSLDTGSMPCITISPYLTGESNVLPVFRAYCPSINAIEIFLSLTTFGNTFVSSVSFSSSFVFSFLGNNLISGPSNLLNKFGGTNSLNFFFPVTTSFIL